jgi:hypothetical protein
VQQGFASSALSANIVATVPGGYERTESPPLGAGTPTMTMTLDYGRSWWRSGTYVQLGGGYRVRGDAPCRLPPAPCPLPPEYADEWVARAEAGTRIGDRFWLAAGTEAVFAAEPATSAPTLEHPYASSRQFVDGHVDAAVALRRNLALATRLRATTWGRDTPRWVATTVSLRWEIYAWR